MNKTNINNKLFIAVDCIENIKDKITDNEYIKLYDSLMAINNELLNNKSLNNKSLNNESLNNESFIYESLNNNSSEYIINEIDRNFINLNIDYVLIRFETHNTNKQLVIKLNKHINNAVIKLKNKNREYESYELDCFWKNILGIIDNYYYDYGLKYFIKTKNIILRIINLKVNENYYPMITQFDIDFLDNQNRLFNNCSIQ